MSDALDLYLSVLLAEHSPWRDRCGGCDEAWPCSVRTLVEALRTAREALNDISFIDSDAETRTIADDALARLDELVIE